MTEAICLRHYDASTGRFLQSDPSPGKLMIPSSLINKYTYAGNNPILFSDPSGKSNFLGWALAAMLPGLSFELMNFTNVFQNNFGFTASEIKTVDFAVVAVAVAILSPELFISATGSSVLQSSATGDWSLNSFENEWINNLAWGVVFSGVSVYFGGSSPIGPWSTDAAVAGLRGAAVTGLGQLYNTDPTFNASVNHFFNNLPSEIQSVLTPDPHQPGGL